MNLRALIIVEDLHRELIDLDGRIAESHAVLKDLAEQDGQNLELHIADRSPKIFSSTVSTEDKEAATRLYKFMQDSGMREMTVLDGRGKKLEILDDVPAAKNKKSIFALDHEEAIMFMQLRLRKLQRQRDLIYKSLEESVMAASAKIT